ncbi:uncharacterized protein LOC133737487 [Rosa rugosa]|uniref:uncharacterized protein LOC133737487 n=1 Tax=Rosa rugosa TaxID=74645 RepID=UPI002B40D95C|nr:uncharacterized protein LOC133737487 [Rosa rugosa]
MNDDDDIDEEYEESLLVQIEEERLAKKNSRRGHRGSVMGHDIVERDPIEGHERLNRDYFANPPKYGARLFRRRFRMKQALFLRIHDAVVAHDNYFVQRRNATGRLGLSSLQKVTAAFRMLAYGVPADYVDEYVQIGESTAIESLKRFVVAVVEVFGDEYLRSPNSDDLTRLLAKGEERGFPGIELAEGRAPPISYKVNGRSYDMGYYLADGIYPSWATLVKTIPAPQGNKHRHFAKEQEGARKDVERAFGVLQARFAIVRGPARFWDKDILKYIMTACIIMHNMIIEDEHDEHEHDRRPRQMHEIEKLYDRVADIPRISPSLERTPTLMEFIENRHRIRDKQMHTQLQEDLVEHLWKVHGGQ